MILLRANRFLRGEAATRVSKLPLETRAGTNEISHGSRDQRVEFLPAKEFFFDRSPPRSAYTRAAYLSRFIYSFPTSGVLFPSPFPSFPPIRLYLSLFPSSSFSCPPSYSVPLAHPLLQLYSESLADGSLSLSPRHMQIVFLSILEAPLETALRPCLEESRKIPQPRGTRAADGEGERERESRTKLFGTRSNATDDH